ncbi:MAG: ThuA domain-containing protein [Planctomycetota bacterium]|jgi:type 1 glutamine amidotransferase
MREALVVQGGWQGHTPKEASEAVAEALEARDFKVEVADSLAAFEDVEKLRRIHLIVPCWTMGKIEKEQLGPLMKAVSEGTGLGGWHGGMCDSFRTECSYQHMTGGQWVAHPGGGEVTYTVNIIDRDHPITQGMKDFEVTSEQYYLHVDPAVKVLATTLFPAERNHGAEAVMPVTWTRPWDEGRVFYTSLGHVAETVRQPEVLEMIMRGLVWAARGE